MVQYLNCGALKIRIEQDGPSLESSSYLNKTKMSWSLGPWDLGTLGPWDPGPLDPWTFGPLDPGTLYSWTSGPLPSSTIWFGMGEGCQMTIEFIHEEMSMLFC